MTVNLRVVAASRIRIIVTVREGTEKGVQGDENPAHLSCSSLALFRRPAQEELPKAHHRHGMPATVNNRRLQQQPCQE